MKRQFPKRQLKLSKNWQSTYPSYSLIALISVQLADQLVTNGRSVSGVDRPWHQQDIFYSSFVFCMQQVLTFCGILRKPTECQVCALEARFRKHCFASMGPPHWVKVEGSSSQGQIQDFGHGGQRSFDPRGWAEPKMCSKSLKYPENYDFEKTNLGGKGAGPQAPGFTAPVLFCHSRIA